MTKRQTIALRRSIFLYKSQERGYHLLENKSLKDHRLLRRRVFQMTGKRGQNVERYKLYYISNDVDSVETFVYFIKDGI